MINWSLTGNLRFIERNGCNILQREWTRERVEKGEFWRDYEWRDVPFSTENITKRSEKV